MAAFNRDKELRASWHASRFPVFASLMSIIALAAAIAQMASAQRPSHATTTNDTRIRKGVAALTASIRALRKPPD